MNKLTNIKKRKNTLGIIIFAVIVIMIGLTLWFLKQRILQNPHAAASTTLAFNPASPTVSSDGTFSSDIMINPGTNQVSLVKLVLAYDKSQVSLDPSGITVNTPVFPQTLDGPTSSCTGTQCTISLTISIGSDPTKAITTPTKVASVQGKSLASSSQTPATITFTSDTSVLSIASTDQANENVLSSSTPLTLNGLGVTPQPSGAVTPTPTSAACQQTTASCAWDNLNGATSYHYKVTDTTTGTVVKEGDLTPPTSSIDFPHQPGDTYTCSVAAVNACKTDQATTVTKTCPVPSASPTITPTPTVTPLPTPTTPITATPAPTSTPVPQLAVCNQSCTTDSNCQNSLVCIGGFCRNPACSSQSTCSCIPPVQQQITSPPQQPPVAQPTQPQYIAAAPTAIPTSVPPKMLPTGPGNMYMQIGIAGIALIVVGGLLMVGL